MKCITLLLLLSLVCSAQIPDTALEVAGITIRTLGTSAGTGNDDVEQVAAGRPVEGSLVLGMSINTKASAPDLPTVSGYGLEWFQIWTTNFNTLASPIARLTAYYAVAKSGITTNGFRATTSAVNQTGWAVGAWEITGVYLGGIRSTNALVQIGVNGVNASATATVTLGTLNNGRNLVVGFIGYDLNSDSLVAQNGFTKIHVGNYATPPTSGSLIYNLKSTQTIVAATNAAAMDSAIIAVEIRQGGT